MENTFEHSELLERIRHLERKTEAYEQEIRELKARAIPAGVEFVVNGMNALDEVVALWDAEDRFILCNERFRAVNPLIQDFLTPGVGFEDFIRLGVAKGAYPQAIGDEEAWISERLARHRTPGDKFELQMADGTWYRIDERKTSDGGTISIGLEISELKQLEREATRNEERFRDFAETASNWFWETDAEGRFVFVTDAFFEVTAFNREDFIGKTRQEIYNTYYTAATSSAAVTKEQHVQNVQDQQAFSDLLVEYPHPDGTLHYFLSNGRPIFGPDGTFEGFRGTSVDITEKHTAEQHLRSLSAALEAITEPVAIFDADDRFQFANEAYRALNSPIAETIRRGERFEDHIRALVAHGLAPNAAGREEAWIRDRLNLHQDPTGHFELNRQDGKWYLGIEKKLPEGGQVLLLTDVSDLKNSQMELEAAKRAAENANATKSVFLANMSHEIRTPMNGVVGMAEILAHTDLDPEQQRLLRTIETSSKALLRIIDDILDISAVEAGKLSLLSKPMAVRDVVTASADAIMSMAIENNVRLSLSIDPDFPTSIQGDEIRLRQVLLNLASNAIKFARQPSDTHPGQVELRAARMGSEWICFSVIDDGIGMTEATKAKLFTPFEQGEDSTTREFGGTGLGLAISANLVRMMGGTIEVESEPGAGTSFTVKIPYVPAPDMWSPEPISHPRNEPGTQAGRTAFKMTDRQARVLLVEDNETNQDVIKTQLNLLGVAVEIAADGLEGLDRWRQGQFDCLLVDCHMPKMDGFQLTGAVREAEAAGDRIPIIAITANALEGEAERCLAAGMDDYLSKPVTLDKLRETLWHWLK